MSCLSWSSRGVRNPRTFRVLRDLLKDHNPSFLFLIETISYVSKIEELRVPFDFDSCFQLTK